MKSKKRSVAPRRSQAGFRRPLVLGVCALVVIAVVVAIVHNRQDDTSSSQTTPGTSTAPVNSKGDQSSGSDKSQSSGSSSDASTSTSDPPKAPYGNLVSNHNAHLGDSELSTCITSPGAKCKIVFSSGGLSKTLDEKTADADGTVYWTWKPQDIGLFAGSWQITATATLNSQTADTTDTRNLTVQP